MRPPVADGEVLGRRISAEAVVPVAEVGEWECGFSGMYRPVVGYNGYTFHHLPVRDNMPLPRREVAKSASFAARMALSNLPIRSLVRYGRRANNRAR